MELSRYLDRIDYTGPVRPDLACLKAIHRQHLLEIPYENLDVQLRRPLDLDIERIFEKIVRHRRGGWCYEMNGLLAWALGEIGFDVERMTGGVARRERGEEMLGNHLVLAVDLEGIQIADVGLGNGLVEPIPLRADRFVQGSREFRLEPLGGELWRFHNHRGALPPDFDFVFAPADEARLEASCAALQSDPESLFRKNLICQRLRPGGIDLLLGRVLVSWEADVQSKRLLESVDEFVETLASRFALADPEAGDLWPVVVARHEAIFAA